MVLLVYPLSQFANLYIMNSLATFLRSDRDLHPNVWSMSVTFEVLWWRCRTYMEVHGVGSFLVGLSVYKDVGVPDSTAFF